MRASQSTCLSSSAAVAPGPRLTAFICANCARGAVEPSARVRRASLPAFDWETEAQEVIVPCSGRLQPEHLLRAFETGSDLVCIVACEQDNCHQNEGSCRAQRRVEYVQRLLQDLGMGAQRLMLVHMPGSAAQDMAVGEGHIDKSISAEELSAKAQSIVAQVAERLRSLPPNPIHGPRPVEEEVSEVEEAEDTND